jgi:hypothetical protein
MTGNVICSAMAIPGRALYITCSRCFCAAVEMTRNRRVKYAKEAQLQLVIPSEYVS